MKLEDYESALNPDQFLEFTNIIRSVGMLLGKLQILLILK